MKHLNDTTKKSSQKTQQNELNPQQNTPLQFPKLFLDPKANPGEMMTEEENSKFLGVNPLVSQRLRLHLEYNKTTDEARKQELLRIKEEIDRQLKAQKESQK